MKLYRLIIKGDNNTEEYKEYIRYKDARKAYNYLFNYLPPYGYNHQQSTHIYKIDNDKWSLKV